MSCKPQLVAIVGGSGSGKSWLADQLRQRLGKEAGRISLDSFYLDRSYLSRLRRGAVNFDHPRAIDWPLFQNTLEACLSGTEFHLPAYDFKTHCRGAAREICKPRPVFLVDGLWLLRRSAIRRCFALSVFLDCTEATRLERRLRRDVLERARTELSVREQFLATVSPMHQRHVEPQRRWADLVISEPMDTVQVERLSNQIRTLLNLNSIL